MKKQNLSSFLKSRTRTCSAQAAVTSLIIHLSLIGFAGSIVAVRYVQKQNAELVARTETRPKLERQKLQSPAAKVEQLQKRALTSKIVSKSVSLSNPEFVLPDTGKIGSLKTQKMSLPGADAGRALKNLSLSRGIGPMRINFFGIRAESEKAVFIIDASSAVLDPRSGGSAAYDYVKAELVKLVSGMKPAMLFNVILYDRQRVFLFRPNSVPASEQTARELAEWIRPVNNESSAPGLSKDQDNYVRPEPYRTAVGSDAAAWLLALQAAFEQRPDNVFLLCAGWGQHGVSAEKQRLLRDFSLWELLSGQGTASVAGTPVFREDRKFRDGLLRRAVDTLRKRDESRKAAGLPAEFLYDIPAYVEYPVDQILSHAETVCREQYLLNKTARPQVHAVRLVFGDNLGKADLSTAGLRELARRYNGGFEFLFSEQVAVVSRPVVKPSPAAVTEPVVTQSVVSAGTDAPASAAQFMGAPVNGSRVAFILDNSPASMLFATNNSAVWDAVVKSLTEAVAGLPDGALFNVFAYNGRQISRFSPQMSIAAHQEGDLTGWLRDLHSGAVSSSGINAYTPSRVYETAVGEDVQAFSCALQAAMEESASTVFVVSSGLGSLPVNPAKAGRLLDFFIWNALGSSSADAGTGNPNTGGEGGGEESVVINADPSAVSGALLQPLPQYKKAASAILKQTIDRIAAERKARQEAGLPPGFVPDIFGSVEYPREQVMAHIAAVCKENYLSKGNASPVVHFVCLQEAGKPPTKETMRDLRGLTQAYGGMIKYFDGTTPR
jgi:hypothetical protein